MKDLTELKSKLLIEIKKPEPFQKVIGLIVQYYMNNLDVSEKEVALLLADKEQTVLSFAAPEYLINAGLIPITSEDAIASAIFRTGNSLIDNNVYLKKRMSIFELIKIPDKGVLPIWKLIAARLTVEDRGIGVIEISRRAQHRSEAGDDFTAADLRFLETTCQEIAPILRQVIPENFKSVLT